jgi:hypothetical protein
MGIRYEDEECASERRSDKPLGGGFKPPRDAGRGSRRPQGEGSRIGAPGGYGVRALGWLRDVRVFLPIRFLYWFPQPGFEALGEPGFGFKGFQCVV